MTTTEIKTDLRSAEAALLSTQIQYKAELHRREWVPEYNAAEALVKSLLNAYREAQSVELKAEIARRKAAGTMPLPAHAGGKPESDPRCRKTPLGIDVLAAARQRIAAAFDEFPRLYISFSAGKDSTVLLHLAAEEARRRKRRIGCLFVDLEGQYKLTIDHAELCYGMYEDVLDPYWVALPMALRNAVSEYEPKWECWDPDREDSWIRPMSKLAIRDASELPFFTRGMEFEEFVPAFGKWYAGDKLTGCLVGIRSDESLNRFRTIAHRTKARFLNWQWSTWVAGTVFNLYPIYDWKTVDVWTYHGKTGLPYNALYDRMQRAGVPLHNQRICQPYGDDQRRGLWLFHLIEPETWSRVVARVNGANSGALYARESGNILGNIKITRPEGHTWESFSMMLLESLPAPAAEHYRNKIAVFLRWWSERGFPEIPDQATIEEEASRSKPSWRRVCKVLLRHDWWCKGLSFTMTIAGTPYDKYLQMMKRRRAEWGILPPGRTPGIRG